MVEKETQPDLGFGVPAATVPTGPAKQQPHWLEATVYGVPRPQGSMNAQRIDRGTRAGQVAVYHQNHDVLMPWRDSIIYALRAAHRGGDPMPGPVGVRAVFALKRPLSAPKRRHIFPAKKPDLDKLLRGVLDAATYAGVWLDDSQVVLAHCYKHYAGDGFDHVLPTPGAYIRIWQIPAMT